MKSNPSSVKNLHPLLRTCLIAKSLGILGSLSLLSAGMAGANTSSFVDNLTPAAAPPPAAPRLAKPTKAKVTPPPPRAAQPAPRPAPPPPRVAKPPRNTTPVARPPAPKPAPRPAVRPTPQPVARPQPTQPTRTVAQPAPSRPAARSPQPNLAAPVVSVPEKKPEIPQHWIDRPNTASARETNNFIDRTDYSTGNSTVTNTPTPTPQRDRPTVVMRNRSTGCEAVMQNGRLSSGSCNVKPQQPRPIARSAPAPRRVSRQSVPAPRISIARESRWQGASVPVASRRIRVVPSPAEWAARVGRSSPVRVRREYHTETEATTSRPHAYPNNGNTGLLFPLPTPARLSSDFGWRVHPIFGNWRMHAGTDIAAPMGTPVIASYHGEVAIAEYVGGYGKMVALRHEDGTQESRYAHLLEIFVEPGDWVEQGQVIGLVGSTGNSTGPHLHFEWRHLMATGWVPVDAGPHLEWAMAEMLNLLDPDAEEAIAAEEMELNEPSLYISSAEELGEMVLGLGTLFEEESDRPLNEEVSQAEENTPEKLPEDSDTTIPTYIKPNEFSENRIQLERGN